MVDAIDTRQDRARAVIDSLTSLAGEFPGESLALWAMIQELRIIAGLTAEQVGGAVTEAAE